MKKKAIAIFTLSMVVLVLSFFGITSAKYKFTVESGLISISTDNFYSKVKDNLVDGVLTPNSENKFILSDLLLCNYDNEKDENYSTTPIKYEVSIFDADQKPSDKFALQYNGDTSGKVNVTVDAASEKTETPLNVRIVENQAAGQYALDEFVTIKVRAIEPYVKELYSKEITLRTVYTLGIGLDYNKYSIVNLSSQSYFTEDDIDWMNGVTLTNVPDCLQGVSVRDVVQCDASSVDLRRNGTYEVSYDNNNTNPHIEIQPNKRTVEVGMIPVTETYNYNSSVPYYTLPYEYKGLNKFELKGARGSDIHGGKGGYTTGTLNSLTYKGELYIYVGGMSQAQVQAGYNGGGNGYHYEGGYSRFNGGGGATDIRLVNGDWKNRTSLASRIMVAGGGGGGCLWGSIVNGGAGGGLTGGKGGAVKGSNDTKAGTATGGSQIAGGNSGGTFGRGANYLSGGAGGGGYYGGGTLNSIDGYRQAGAGGSSYISGHAGCIAIKSETDITPKVQTYSQISDSYHYSGLVFSNTSMSQGTNNGHGSAKITTYLVRSNISNE